MRATADPSPPDSDVQSTNTLPYRAKTPELDAQNVPALLSEHTNQNFRVAPTLRFENIFTTDSNEVFGAVFLVTGSAIHDSIARKLFGITMEPRRPISIAISIPLSKSSNPAPVLQDHQFAPQTQHTHLSIPARYGTMSNHIRTCFHHR